MHTQGFFCYIFVNVKLAAFIESLYTRQEDWVKVAAKYGGGAAAEDVVQDSYIKLIEWHRKQNAPKLTDALFFFIVRNTALDYARKATHERGDEDIENREYHEPPPQDEQDKMTEIIHAQLHKLHWFDAKVMDIYFNLSRTHNEQLSMRELSRETGISLSTIFTTIQKCKQIIQTEIESASPASARNRKV